MTRHSTGRGRNLPSALLFGTLLFGIGATATTPLRAADRDSWGQIFTGTVRMTIPDSANASRWTLRDIDGKVVANGSTRSVQVRPGPGYFELQAGSWKAALAVVRKPAAHERNDVLGVMTHFAQGWSTDLLPALTLAGINRVRDEQYWSHVERTRGVMRFPDGLAGYMQGLDRFGIDPLLVLSFENALYDGGQTPYSDDGLNGFAAYARSVVRAYRRQVRAVEVWNEYNGTWCKGPCTADRPAHYARLLERTHGAVKAEAPDITVVGGAAVLAPLPWFEGLFEHGALDHMDVLAIHPYRTWPEGVERDVRALQDAMRRHRTSAIPIWATEFGRMMSEADRRQGAAYLVRMTALMRSAGVERMYWYLLRDYDKFKGMGLLRDPDDALGRYAPTPAYVAASVAGRTLSGLSFVERAPTDPRTYLLRFAGAGRTVHLLWAPDEPAALSLTAGKAGLTAVDLYGRPAGRAAAGRTLSLRAGPEPVYLLGSVSHVREDREDEVLSSLSDAFSDRQGGGGWRYEAVTAPPDAGCARDAGTVEQPVWTHDAWSYQWTVPAVRSAALKLGAAHPGVRGNRQVCMVARWNAAAAGPIRVTVTASRGSLRGDGTRILVRIAGREAASMLLTDRSQTTIEGVGSVAAGADVEVAVSPGPGLDANNDAISLAARITGPRKR